MLDHEAAIAELADVTRIMTHQQDRVSCTTQFAEASFALDLEPGVSNRKDFVENDNLPRCSKRDGVAEAHGHAARVVLQPQVRKVLQFRKVQNLVHSLADFQ